MKSLLSICTICSAVAVSLLFCSSVFAVQHEKSTPNNRPVILLSPDQLEWRDGPKSLPEGCQYMLLSGNPNKPGLFVMRLKFPANYQLPAHHHLTFENVTVLSGEINFGLGNKLDKSQTQLFKAGSFVSFPAKVNHFAWTGDSEVVLQLNNMGPWEMIYVDPKTDPRK